MFKLFQNLLPSEASSKTDSPDSKSNIAWKEQIARADVLWEQGKLSEALALYGLAIEQNPNTVEIRQHLAERVKQQGDIAVAYEKLATELKNQGEIEQAANYYRQAINLKALTGNTKDTLLKSRVSAQKRPPIPLANLKEAAFSFQPLARSSAIVKATPPASRSPTESDNVSPKFTQRLKTIDANQAKDIDWETAQVYLQKALDHLEQQEWQQSAQACQQATKIMPEMAEAYKIWGNALQRMGKTGEAMSCYAKAVEIKPNLAEVYAGIADIYVQQEKWAHAVKHYQKAIIIKPSAEIHRSLANVWQKLGETEKVEFNLYQAAQLEELETAPSTEIDPDSIESDRASIEESIEAYCKIAQQLERQNQWQQAATYYRQALDLSMSRLALPPQHSNQERSIEQEVVRQPPGEISVKDWEDREDRSDRTVADGAQSQLDKAIARYHRQSKLQPNSPKIFTDLGNLYARKGKLHYAIACYRKSIKLNRKYAKAHLNLSRILLKVGKQQEFIKTMQLALSLEPKIGNALDRFYLGNALVDRGREQEAIGYYYKAIVLNPKFSQSYRRLSEILSKRGKHEKAIEFLEQEIAHNPQNPEAYYFMAQQWEILQNWENAVKLYSHVLRLDPQFPEASQKLNHALAEKLKSNRQAKSKSAN